MFSSVKLKLWRFYLRIKKRNIENFVIERIECQGLEKSTEQLIVLAGWYHFSKSKVAPSLAVIVDDGLYKPLSVNIRRYDVQRTYGSTQYPNGFSISFLVKASATEVVVVNELSDSELYSRKIADIPIKTVVDPIGKSEISWVAKIPMDVRTKLAEKHQNDGYLVGAYTSNQMIYDLLKYFCRPTQQKEGYNIISYVSGTFGVAEAGRAFIDYQIKKNIPIALFDYCASWHNSISRQEEEKYISLYFQSFIYDTNIFLIDIHEAQRIKEVVPELFENKRSVTSFWWEFETGFEKNIPVLNQFDEVFVFSEFILNILAKAKRRKFAITKIAYPFYENWSLESDKSVLAKQYNLEGEFLFFFNFDFSSSYARKNPLASLKAFYQEFQHQDNAMFVYKVSSADRHRDAYGEFLDSINQYNLQNKVLVIDDSLTKNEFMSLLNTMDCYVSLHRGEGLGLGILEALALEIPVIATNYGGNTEYMDHPLAHPVNYKLVPCVDDFHLYADVKKWADPNIDQASIIMREIYENVMEVKLTNQG